MPVPVVVRDKKSNAIGTLKAADFQIFDNGKPQTVTLFSVEKSNGGGSANPSVPSCYFAYVFDDLHFNTSDLMKTRLAAMQHFDQMDLTATRAAVFTTSGATLEDFTASREKLKAALTRLTSRPQIGGLPERGCPALALYGTALAITDNYPGTYVNAGRAQRPCSPLSSPLSLVANGSGATTRDEIETPIVFSALRGAIKRLAMMPGDRTLVLVSPGFAFYDHPQEMSELIDLAVRVHVVINSIDGRGLWVNPRFGSARSASSNEDRHYNSSDDINGDSISLLAEGTGGTMFLNSNDLVEGFRRTGSTPEYTYLLGFAPQGVKNDGKYHALKVKVNSSNSTVQSRRGYYAPKNAVDPAMQARQDIDKALFSREELKSFPLTSDNHFSKGAGNTMELTVMAQVGLKEFHFVKSDGLNRDQLTLVAALFDQNGNYVSGTETNVAMHYQDSTLAAHRTDGLKIKSSFEEVKPGTYLVRLVARDAEGQTISATNAAVEIP